MLWIIPFLFLATPSEAAKKVDLKPKQEKVEDPGSATPLIYKTPPKDIPQKESNDGTVKIAVTCTDNLGMVHKKGSKSYEACLRNQDKTRPESNFNEKNPKSVGITIGR